ncbi:efflux RND transporter periplasmic adaptor subunit [Marinimicrobium alkaliphilum]|uniref:efflux RND transporter periplasmic adaptor subunit n=1 Tax=Marinimicrobium alkaliphilum TaxID=2202654 RepID=UPI001E4F18BE|nr:efflux RND transporter periplasmic adaptor subunit [Marinimicrobium alkaliphilum]
MNNRFLAFLGAMVLSAGALAQEGDEGGPQVIVKTVAKETIENRIEALGNLRANESIRVTSNITKTVTRLNFEDGQRVERGHILVEMTSAEELALLEEGRVNTDEAERQLERVRSLVERGAASQSILDQRTREFESARARYAAIESRLEDLRLRAPFDGVVGLRNISVGALVTPGDLITTLNDDSRMKLDFTVPAVSLRHLQTGLPVVARSRAFGDREFEGEVVSIDNQIDLVTRAVTVRALLPNDEGLLRQGMLMNVELLTEARESLVIPEAAILALGNEQYVFVVVGEDGDKRSERRTVHLGERFLGRVEVLDGLEAGEQVVTHGLQRVRDGQPVRILTEDTGDRSVRDMLNAAQQ